MRIIFDIQNTEIWSKLRRFSQQNVENLAKVQEYSSKFDGREL